MVKIKGIDKGIIGKREESRIKLKELNVNRIF